MLTPQPPKNWARPSRRNTAVGDGSVFRPLSDVYLDEKGNPRGSRANPDSPRKQGPRLGTRRPGKDRKGRSAVPS